MTDLAASNTFYKNNPLIEAITPPDLLESVKKVADEQFEDFFHGVEAYHEHAYQREIKDKPVLMELGTTRLIDYGAKDKKAPIIFVIPSLVNKFYILDLMPKLSFLEALVDEGYHPIVIDWDEPGEEEKEFSLDDYTSERLLPFFDYVKKENPQTPTHVLGYCMGGMMSLPLAQSRQSEIEKLILLASPWDFHRGLEETPVKPQHMEFIRDPLDLLVKNNIVVPVDILQSCFYALDPFLVIKKFVDFANMDMSDPKAEKFVALEDWINDGVPLAPKVAWECFMKWFEENTPARNEWEVLGQAVDPSQIDLDTLVIAPHKDRIVPFSSSSAIMDHLTRGTLLTPNTGHIGAVTSTRAPELVWNPMFEWLKS